MLQLLIALAAGVIGFVLARGFVRRRLRFVDKVHSPLAPVVAGFLAAVVATPLIILPFVTLTTAVLFGIGTGLGTVSGSRDVRHATGDHHRLAP
jgi:hypothetical protein